MNVQQYEEHRNKAILFFLERLLEKGEKRSLHDLSCQFGTKGFNKEMKQIAGGSKSGLKKFLAQYPSLFTIVDDEVSVASVTAAAAAAAEDSSRAVIRQDYAQEAKMYFKKKLMQYGEGVEVPIKSLLGHRSQAPPAVRHIAGQHLADFKEFLCQHQDEFTVTNHDTIVLKSNEADDKASGRTEKPDNNGSSSGKDVPQIVDELLTASKTCNINDILHNVRKHNFSAVNLDEQGLKSILRLYPNKFILDGNSVSLAANNNSLSERVKSILQGTLKYNNDRNTNNHQFRRRQQQRLNIVSDFEECNSILADFGGNNRPVAVQLKGANIGSEGTVTTIFLSKQGDECVHVLDVLSIGERIFNQNGSLKRILETDAVVKVIHDSRHQSANLWCKHGIELSNVFDTQSAYAMTQKDVSNVHKVKTASFTTLSEHCGLTTASVGQNGPVTTRNKRDPKMWLKRPLDKDAIESTANECYSLSNLIYPHLDRSVSDKGLLGELCQEQVEFYIKPEEVREKQKSRKMGSEIQEIQKKILNCSDEKPIVLTNKELRLLRFLELSEEDVKKIGGSAKVAKKLERLGYANNEGENNPPSLESTTSSTESASSPSFDSLQGLDRIEKLEALITNLTATSDDPQQQPQLLQQQQLQLRPVRSDKTFEDRQTQTISTGDIVMTKMFSP